MSRPVFSIGIASYNNADYLEILLESIRQQTYSAIELIVIDDCSKDNSVTVLQQWIERTKYPVTFVSHEQNQGLVRTFSACTQLATGRYISLIGSDDILDPTFVAETVAEFELQGESCGAVYTDCRLIDAQGVEIAPSFLRHFDSAFADCPPQGNLIIPLLKGFYLPTVTTSVRREALEAVGPYDETLFSEDLDMWLRISRNFRFAYFAGNLGSYRVHDRSAVHTNKLSLNETYFRIYRKGYFQGEEEWAAARYNLANHAEHYYANQGQNASYLWYAFKETRSIKIYIFYIMSLLGVKYSRVMSLVDLLSR